MFFGFAFYIANEDNRFIRRKMIGIVMLFVFACSFFELLFNGYVKGTPIKEYFTASAEFHTGGGFMGGLFVSLFGILFGIIGAYILTMILIMISVIVMTQKPLVTHFGRKAKSANAQRKQRLEERRKMREAEEAEWEDDEIDSTGYMPDDDFDEIPVSRKPIVPSGVNPLDNIRKAAKGKKSSTVKPIDSVSPASDGTEAVDLSGGKIASSDADEYGNIGSVKLKPVKFEPVVEETADNESTSFPHDPSVLSESFRESLRKNSRRQEEPLVESSTIEVPFMEEEASERPYIPADTGITEIFDTSLNDQDVDADSSADDFADDAMGTADGMDQEAAEKPARRKAKVHSSDQQIAEDVNAVKDAIAIKDEAAEEEEEKERPYVLPTTDLLKKGKGSSGDSEDYLAATARKLQETFHDFGVNVRVTDISCGPSVTRYELQPEHGVKVARILSLQDDIKLALAATNIRIEAPVPGKSVVGIEVPNKEVSPVFMRDMLESKEFREFNKPLAFAVGKDISGKQIVFDIAKMPHLLIAGTTGSGKSVCINTLIMSILFKSSPKEVKMLMIDPKMVELKIYDSIPHLLIPVVTDVKKASGALNWAVAEMQDRYNRFAEMTGVRDIDSYNERVRMIKADPAIAENPEQAERLKEMPRIVVIVDELADLMMVAPGEVEEAIVRLSQLARAAGIHVVIATQRPSVNVVTGLIKANMPSRIALTVNSGVDSRTIIDMNGAEKLLGRGDMLFYPQGYTTPLRVQGGYVDDAEIMNVVKFLSSQQGAVYNSEVEQKITESLNHSASSKGGSDGDDRDELFWQAGQLIIEKDKASIGTLQRMFRIGFNRAARIMDQLCDAGVVGEEQGTKPREILMSEEQFENFREQGG
ncbi:MAG: DNA translocase FtsK [Lachnospiraceae bacterium]|nr:DNA translocase FtsK [Candidatus Equihabitans merdae]